MKIAARVSNMSSGHTVEVETEARKQSIVIAPKSVRRGSSINGGELLFAALATCFCNDLHREAAKRAIDVREVKVEVTGILEVAASQHVTSVTAPKCVLTLPKPNLTI